VETINEEAERRRIVNRLKRLEGQIRGLQTMIESGKNCEAVLTQIMAAKSALNQVGLHIIGHAMKGCMIGDEDISRDDLINRTFDVLKRYREIASANTPIGDKTPADPQSMALKLRETEVWIAKIREMIETGADCEQLVAEVSQAAGSLNDIALGVLGHSMKSCLVGHMDSKEELVDGAIAVFLKYSSCVK
jgi:DNA-binding FrmR family transcriptional regulator